MDFGERLRHIRKAHRMTTTELAKIVGCSQSYLSAFENGRRVPDLDMAERISQAFKMSLSEFLADDQSDSPDLFRLVQSAKKLTPKQREAVVKLIDTLTDKTSE